MILMLQLDDKKSPGPHDIPINILKMAAPIIVPLPVNEYNLSFKSGVFPDQMKLAKVIPLFKAGSKLLLSNYRPICSKLFEKIVFKHFYNHLTLNHLITKNQSGFWPTH